MKSNDITRISACIFLISAFSVQVKAAALPDTISPPKGLNLGSTSFFDGFGRTTPGFTLLEYGRYEILSHINDYEGNGNHLFKGTHITVFSVLSQISYVSPWHPFGGDGVGASFALPVVNFNSHFDATSPVKLQNNGLGIGDLAWGPFYQSKYYLRDDKPFFAWRTQLIIESPTGDLSHQKSLNQGAGYWALNPFVTFTYLPIPRVEVSNRFNYQYNFQGNQFSNPPVIPHVTYVNGQGGQVIYDNFTASYAVTPNGFLGLNGFFLDQLNADKTNGQKVPHSIESQIYLGPGGRYDFDNVNSLNANLYLPVFVRNTTSGPKINFQYIHRF